MRIVFACCVLFFSQSLLAQEVVLTPLAPNYVKPGVAFKSPSKGLLAEYGLQPNLTIRTSEEESQDSRISRNSNLHFKLKIPIIHKDHTSFLLGVDYQRERFRFDFIEDNSGIFSSIDADALRTTRISSYFFKSINEKVYGTIKLEGSFNGDYNSFVNFDDRYANWRAALIIGVKKSVDTEYGFGAQFNKGIRNTRVFPFAFFNKTFSEKWGIETVLPVQIKARYNFSPTRLLLFGPQFKSRTYSINVNEAIVNQTNEFAMRRSELELSASYQHRFSKWIWGEFKTGYRLHFDTRFERKTSNGYGPNITPVDLVTASPSSGLLFRFGIFLSPPKF